ncbi:MAG: hypothetical protein EXR18_05070 [Flavobacteriaceae bacterium]|nr:hypothetical protein [Flavobacteriaceae bacterium]
MESNNWINDILYSTTGITKVTPDAHLFSKIQNRINNQNIVSNKWIWIVAASFSILVSLNIKMLLSNSTKPTNAKEPIEMSVSNSNQLY